MNSTCVERDCERPVHCRGYCSAHYQKARRAGVFQVDTSTWHRLTSVDVVNRTGVCSICGPTSVRVRKTRAHECHARTKAEWARNRPASREAKRNRLLRDQYGLSAELYDGLMQDQAGGCAICGAERSSDGRRLAVDHCHTTGQVRGLLCNRCNRGIGMFSDDPQLMRQAIAYLTRD